MATDGRELVPSFRVPGPNPHALDGRNEPREVAELRALKLRTPELTDAVDLHLELHDLIRRVQGRVPVPWFDFSEATVQQHASTGTPLIAYADLRVQSTDLRLLVRQIAEAFARHDALETDDLQVVKDIERRADLPALAEAWLFGDRDRRAPTAPQPHDVPPALAQVFTMALRPWLGKCADALHDRRELDAWGHAYCPLCGAEPGFSVVGADGQRSLMCGRCTLRWHYVQDTCPFCANTDPHLMTSFGTPDGAYRVNVCDACRRYIKAIDVRRAARPPLPFVDAAATLPLDAYVVQRGYL